MPPEPAPGHNGLQRLVKDLNSSVTGPNRTAQTRTHAVMGGTLFFAGHEAATGTELWKSDGTEAGTVLVKNITPGPSSSDPGFFVVHGDTLYFSAGNRLWKTDGTELGTVAVMSAGCRLVLEAIDSGRP